MPTVTREAEAIRHPDNLRRHLDSIAYQFNEFLPDEKWIVLIEHFNFCHGKNPDGSKRHYRFSLDKHLGRRISSKSEADTEAERIRIAIRDGIFGTVNPRLKCLQTCSRSASTRRRGCER